jgi:chromosome segregation ATPase
MARSLVTRYTSLRAKILERVRKVNRMTEASTLQAGNSLQQVVATARTHISYLGTFLLGSTDSALQQAIARHAVHVLSHAAKLDRAVSAHAAEMALVAASVREIKAAAKEVERANTAARLLALNARIEAFRSDAQVFKTIAVEMNDLARNITSANSHVQELANTMSGSLPKLIEQSEALREMATEFTAEARLQIGHVDREVDALRDSVARTLRVSDDSLATIISASHEALSALQVQDVCAQGLLQLDGWQAAELRETAAAFDLEVEIAPEVEGISRETGILDHEGATGHVVLF